MKREVKPAVLVNGAPADTIAVADRGLQYGDGLFETFAVVDGAPELWARHWARLARGCERLRLPTPVQAQVRAEADALCAGVARGVLKLVWTRGVGGRGYRPPEPCRPTRIVSLHPWPDYPAAWFEHGIAVRWCEHPVSLNPRLAGLKHLNRLDQVLARAEWDDPGIAEGLMCNPAGHVIEATAGNVFAVRGGRLLTPALVGAGVAGVMRALVLKCAAGLGIHAREAVLERAALESADELLLSNSLSGVLPVRALGERRYATPRPLTRALAAAVAVARRSA